MLVRDAAPLELLPDHVPESPRPRAGARRVRVVGGVVAVVLVLALVIALASRGGRTQQQEQQEQQGPDGHQPTGLVPRTSSAGGILVMVHNLEKQSGLATKLVRESAPDVMLAQEINWDSESDEFRAAAVRNTSPNGYGTAIYAATGISNVRMVNSPHAEVGGTIVKKTTVAVVKGVHFVSFHGYNGQPFKKVENLVDHVNAVLAVVPRDGSPVVFAGDFNTWTQEHLDAVTHVLEEAGFLHAASWAYPGRDFPLDHVYLRGLTLERHVVFQSASDHQGAVLEVVPQ